MSSQILLHFSTSCLGFCRGCKCPFLKPKNSLFVTSIKKVNGCFILIYPATLLYSVMTPSNLSIDPYRFSVYSVYEYCQFYSFLSITHNLFFLPYSDNYDLSTMLNGSIDSRHPCLIAELKGNISSILLLNIMFVLALGRYPLPSKELSHTSS